MPYTIIQLYGGYTPIDPFVTIVAMHHVWAIPVPELAASMKNTLQRYTSTVKLSAILLSPKETLWIYIAVHQPWRCSFFVGMYFFSRHPISKKMWYSSAFVHSSTIPAPRLRTKARSSAPRREYGNEHLAEVSPYPAESEAFFSHVQIVSCHEGHKHNHLNLWASPCQLNRV